MDNFLGEIRTFGFGRIPKNWAPCQGQLLPVAQNQALFSLLGVRYGGNGVTTFGLPDFRGVVAIAQSINQTPVYPIGSAAGQEFVTLNQTQIPPHSHVVKANDTMGNNFLNANDDYMGQLSVYVAGPTSEQYSVNGYVNNPEGSLVPLKDDTVVSAGGGQPHENRMPYLTANVCIALAGIFPSRS